MLLALKRRKVEDTLLDAIYGKVQSENFDLDDVMASAVQGGRHEEVKPSHLARI